MLVKLTIIFEGLDEKLPILIKHYQELTPEQAKTKILQLAEYDPTPNKQYLPWIIKQDKTKTCNYPEDGENTKELLTKFNKTKHKLDIKDINKYTYPQLAKTINDYNIIEQQIPIYTGTTKIYDKDNQTILKITDPKSLSKYSENTEWCTKARSTAMDYLSKGALYVVYRDNVKYVLIDFPSNQCQDIYNQEVNFEDKEMLYRLVSDLDGLVLYSFYDFVMQWCGMYGRRWPEAEPYIMRDPKSAIYYARDFIKGRWPEAEPIIMRDPLSACYYARNVIGGRWPEAEPIIMNNHDAYRLYNEAFRQK